MASYSWPLNPVLPNELQREIFELVATSSIYSALQFLSVSKKVLIWIQPLVYEVVVVHQRNQSIYYPPGIARRLPQVFQEYGKYIRSLSVDDIADIDNQVLFLEHCPNVSNLAFHNAEYPTDDCYDSLQKLPLRRLSCELSDLRELLNPTSPMLINLSHLDLINSNPETWKGWEVLASFPKLTHLATDDCSTHDEIPLSALKHCKLLQVLVIVVRDDDDSPLGYLQIKHQFDAEDDRIVAILRDPVKHWMEEAAGRPDMWDFAEGIVEERRKKVKTTGS